MQERESDAQLEQMALHPSDISVAATFLDILFGVLLGIIVLEFKPEDFLGKTFGERLLFSSMYAALLLKFFFHWYGIRSDSAVLGSFLNYSADVSKYLSGIFVAFTYFACIKLLIVWFAKPVDTDWALRWVFGVLAGFKMADTVTNLTTVRDLVRGLVKKVGTLGTIAWPGAVKIIEEWYLREQPKVVLGFFASVPFLAAAAMSESAKPRYIAAAVFLVVEGSVEARLSWKRLRMWQSIVAITDGRASP